MKNRIYIYAILLMTIAATMAPKAMCQTELYKQYKHLTDVKVICIMKFPINDTTTTSLTLFVPKTKEAVYYLVEEFNLGIEKDIIDEGLGNEENNFLKTYNVRKDDVREKFGSISSLDDYKSISRLLYRYSTGLVLVFHDIETKERSMAITSFINKSTKNPKILPNIEQILK
ncbi:MAG: hypothetical protein J6V54_08390 [Bacteroidales bacterium]|nr:hypothetical protein [Bacteroidales bacterium]